MLNAVTQNIHSGFYNPTKTHPAFAGSFRVNTIKQAPQAAITSGLLKVYFAGNKSVTEEKESSTKALKNLNKVIKMSASKPQAVDVYIEDGNFEVFCRISKVDDGSSFRLKVFEGNSEGKGIEDLEGFISKSGEIKIISSKDNAQGKDVINQILEHLAENDSSKTKLAPKNPIIEKETLYDALRKMGTKRLKKQYRKEWSSDNPTFGYCYVTAEMIYHYLAPQGSKPCCARTSPTVVHWWVETPDGTILDGTGDQFQGQKIPYHEGKGCGFLTKQPSKRAQELAALLGLTKKI